jgi:Icc-related predicted phosphoesterase
MNIKESAKWYFPPTTNRKGTAKREYDSKTVMIIESNLFDHPLIAMSDMHSQTPELLVMLDEFVNLDKFVVLTAGDMSGAHIRGSDGTPTLDYEFLAQRSREFYFVQGNHDRPDPDNKQNVIKNKENKYSGIQDGTVITSLVGSIGGVNGIISNKSHPYKMSGTKYQLHLKKVLSKRPYILMTHDTPSIDKYYQDKNRYIGNLKIFEIVDKYKPKIHFYGHCHHPTIHNLINGVNYINLDARVLIFIKPGNNEELFKKTLENMYSPGAQQLYEYDTVQQPQQKWLQSGQ